MEIYLQILGFSDQTGGFMNSQSTPQDGSKKVIQLLFHVYVRYP